MDWDGYSIKQLRSWQSIRNFIVGILAGILFSSFGLKYTALLSVLVGLSVLIPYVGAFTVTIPIVIIGLLQFGLGTQFYLLVGLYLLPFNLLMEIYWYL